MVRKSDIRSTGAFLTGLLAMTVPVHRTSGLAGTGCISREVVDCTIVTFRVLNPEEVKPEVA
jgi:hypothetical protein